MTLLNKIILFLAITFFSAGLKAQNFYDEEHSAKFAEYLFQSQQFDLAAQEYERLVFSNSNKINYQLNLLKSYRKSGNYPIASKRFQDLYKDSAWFAPEPIAQEYIHLLMLENNLPQAWQFNSMNKNIPGVQQQLNLLQLSLLSKNWKQADSISNLIQNLDPEYKSLLTDASQMKKRYPGVALTFSMIVPGTGKIYSGYWKDGIISLLFVAATGWQSYRGFSKKGSESVSGWIWGSISTGFYLGNLYGSFKAAKRFNNRQNELLHKRAESYIYSTF